MQTVLLRFSAISFHSIAPAGFLTVGAKTHINVMKYTVSLWVGWVVACHDPKASLDRNAIVLDDAPKVIEMVRADLKHHEEGLLQLAQKLGPGFDLLPERKEKELRLAMRILLKPPKGIQSLYASPRTFVASVDTTGQVICRDSEPDRLRGFKLSDVSKAVKHLLAGENFQHEIIELPNPEDAGKPSVVWLMGAPVYQPETHQISGAVVLGIPLWRYAQRITKQLQVNHLSEKEMIVWAYLMRGNRLHHFGTPPDLDKMIPKPETIAAGLARSKGGFTGQFNQFNRWYAYGVLPLTAMTENTAPGENSVGENSLKVIIVRSKSK